MDRTVCPLLLWLQSYVEYEEEEGVKGATGAMKKPQRATSRLPVLSLAGGAPMAAVGVVFLMEVRRMWEVLCM